MIAIDPIRYYCPICEILLVDELCYGRHDFTSEAVLNVPILCDSCDKRFKLKELTIM